MSEVTTLISRIAAGLVINNYQYIHFPLRHSLAHRWDCLIAIATQGWVPAFGTLLSPQKLLHLTTLLQLLNSNQPSLERDNISWSLQVPTIMLPHSTSTLFPPYQIEQQNKFGRLVPKFTSNDAICEEFFQYIQATIERKALRNWKESTKEQFPLTLSASTDNRPSRFDKFGMTNLQKEQMKFWDW